jgi:hypothetical protein
MNYKFSQALQVDAIENGNLLCFPNWHRLHMLLSCIENTITLIINVWIIQSTLWTSIYRRNQLHSLRAWRQVLREIHATWQVVMELHATIQLWYMQQYNCDTCNKPYVSHALGHVYYMQDVNRWILQWT